VPRKKLIRAKAETKLTRVHGEFQIRAHLLRGSRSCWDCAVRDLIVLFLHLLATVARLAGPGGARSVVAESVLVKQQLLILNRSRKRSPNLRPAGRVVAGLCALFMRRGRLIRSAIVVKPSTLLRLHRALIQRKYRRLLSSKAPVKPGRKGPSHDVIAAVVDMKRRDPIWGCPRIAQQITLAFGIPINKDVVRRILAARYEPKPESTGPSWLTVLGHAKGQFVESRPVSMAAALSRAVSDADRGVMRGRRMRPG
jgi:putative transposase